MSAARRLALAVALLVPLLAVRPAASRPPGGPGGPEGPVGMAGGVLGGGPPGGAPAFMEQLFPPRLVMENQQELGLKPAQVDAIKKAILEAQQKLVDLQWKLEADTEALAKMLAQDEVDEAAVLAKLAEVTASEQRVKTINLTLLVRIKNELDPAQQAKLRALRRARPQRPHPPPPQGMPSGMRGGARRAWRS
jgi:Spy/CpxP family protein refolding chaperone